MHHKLRLIITRTPVVKTHTVCTTVHCSNVASDIVTTNNTSLARKHFAPSHSYRERSVKQISTGAREPCTALIIAEKARSPIAPVLRVADYDDANVCIYYIITYTNLHNLRTYPAFFAVRV
jgi:hypothetical protein